MDEKYYGFFIYKFWLMGFIYDEVNVEWVFEDKNLVFYMY